MKTRDDPHPQQRRLLALDGGGIRGVITLEILRKLERDLRAATARPRLVLGEWFDYIGGTSTGAIVAAGLALGMEVDDLRRLYAEHGAEMFDASRLRDRLRFRYDDGPLARMLQAQFGAETTLGSDRLRCLLMVMLRNATTDSPWPLSSNPAALFNDRSRPECNLDLPLWQVVRASTAAPVYFPPETVQLGEGDEAERFVFVDGGVTPYNNPAFQLFLMATLPEYAVGWQTGEDDLLLVSVGTGNTPFHDADLEAEDLHLLRQLTGLPGGLMVGAAEQQDLLCRVLGRCRHGPTIDSEVGALTGDRGLFDPRLFTYVRYDEHLSRDRLASLGFPDVRPAEILAIDRVDHIDELRLIGAAIAERDVELGHLAGFVEPKQ